MRKSDVILPILGLVILWILSMLLLYTLWTDNIKDKEQQTATLVDETLVPRYTVVTEYGTFDNVDHGTHSGGVAKLFLTDGSVVWVGGSFLMTEN